MSAPEPLLVKTMRAHPERVVEVVGDFGMKSRARARGFVEEFDAYAASRYAEGYDQGHAAAMAYVEAALHNARKPKEPEPILDLEPDESYDIRGRGLVHVFGSPPEGIYEPDQLNGRQVRIKGSLYLVRGVERYAIPLCTPERPYTHGFGLLVRPLPEEKEDA